MKNNKIMKVEIDPDTADRVVVCSLKKTMKYIREDIAALKQKKKLGDYEKEDLIEFAATLHAMEEVFDYYGGNLK
jgi:hypothetical protein